MYQIARAASLGCDYNTKLSRSHWTLNLWIIQLSWEQQVLERKKINLLFPPSFWCQKFNDSNSIEGFGLVWLTTFHDSAFFWMKVGVFAPFKDGTCVRSAFRSVIASPVGEKKITLGISFWCWYWSKISQLKSFKKAISLFLEKVHHKKIAWNVLAVRKNFNEYAHEQAVNL